MKYQIQKNISYNLEFKLFGKSFSYPVAKKYKKLHPKSLLQLIASQVIDADYEWARKDGKKVILFYEQSSLPHHKKYIFSVEADSELELMMKQKYDDQFYLNNMIDYMYENQNKLNFI